MCRQLPGKQASLSPGTLQAERGNAYSDFRCGFLLSFLFLLVPISYVHQAGIMLAFLQYCARRKYHIIMLWQQNADKHPPARTTTALNVPGAFLPFWILVFSVLAPPFTFSSFWFSPFFVLSCFDFSYLRFSPRSLFFTTVLFVSLYFSSLYFLFLFVWGWFGMIGGNAGAVGQESWLGQGQRGRGPQSLQEHLQEGGQALQRKCRQDVSELPSYQLIN